MKDRDWLSEGDSNKRTPSITIRVRNRQDLAEALNTLYEHASDWLGEDDHEALNAIGQAQDLLREAMIGDEGGDDED